MEKLTLKQKEKIKKIVNEQVNEYKDLSDFDLRERLIGYKILSTMLLRHYFTKESREFKITQRLLFLIFGKMFEKSIKNCKKFTAKCFYKQNDKTKKIQFYNFNCLNERNLEEVIERIKQRKEFNKKNGELKILEIKELTAPPHNPSY